MVEKLKNRSVLFLKKLADNFKLYFPVAVAGILLCVLVDVIYGSDMMCIAVVCAISLKELYNTTFNISNYLRNIVTLFVIITIGVFAGINPFVATAINFVFVGFTAFVFCDNFRIGGVYFNMCLQLLIMEYEGGIELYRIPFAFLCALLCIMCCVTFLIIWNVVIDNFFRKHRDDKYVIDGCKSIANKLRMFIDDENSVKDKDLFMITTEFCNKNYNSMVNQGYILDETKKREFLSLMTLQQLSDLIYDTKSKFTEINDNDLKYFEELYRIFSKIKSLKRLAIELNGFVDDYSLSNPQMSSLWKKYLLTLVDYLKYRSKPVIKGEFKEAFRFRVSVLKKRLSISYSYNLRKALQTACIVAICTLLGQILPMTDAMMLPVVSLAVLSIYPEVKLRYTIPGFIGMIIVSCVYTVVLSAIPFSWRLSVVFIVTMFAIVTVNSTFMKSAFATQLISVVVFPTAVVGGEVLIKIGMMLFGCCLSWVLVRWFFNTASRKKYKFHTSDLAQTDWTAMSLLQHSKLNNSTTNYLCELMFMQYLMVEHINNSSDEKIDSNKIRYSSMLSFNCDLLSEISYAITILKPVVLPNDWIIAMKKRLTNVF